ncbi:MAG: DUF2232 domain-containing protein [Bdellovibrio bacteriovorus]
MKALAGFIMRGYAQAALVAAASALLSLLLPPFALVSGAAIALVTLRRGLREGALLGGLATLGVGLLSALALGTPWPALGTLLVLWLPVWALAALLRHFRSLSLTIAAAGGIGVLIVIAFHALVADPAAVWRELMTPFREVLIRDGVVEPPAADALFAAIAHWMTGAFAAALVLQWILGLFLGRWWQALLYNPGGFGQELRELRLHRAFGIAGLALLAATALVRGPGLIPDLLIVLLPLYLLQGLAVIHQIHRARRLHPGWLFALYALLVVFMPHAELLVACLGLVDIWSDLRARLAQAPGGGV